MAKKPLVCSRPPSGAAQHLGQRLKDIVDALDDFSDENLINACLEMDVELKKVRRGTVG